MLCVFFPHSDPTFPFALLHMEDVWRCDKRTARLVLPIAIFSNYHGATIWSATSTIWLGNMYDESYGGFDILNAGYNLWVIDLTCLTHFRYLCFARYQLFQIIIKCSVPELAG